MEIKQIPWNKCKFNFTSLTVQQIELELLTYPFDHMRRSTSTIQLQINALANTLPNIQIYKYSNTQIYKYTNTQIHKYTNTQICKYTNIQIYNYKNIHHLPIRKHLHLHLYNNEFKCNHFITKSEKNGTIYELKAAD